MRKAAIIILVAASAVAAQRQATRAPRASTARADQLGLACTQILDLSSTAWVNKFTDEKGAELAETLRAIETYAKCYDARTDQLAASLRRTAKGPLMRARENFQNVEKAIDAFTTKALIESQPPANRVKTAYAALYEKQFRYEFYESYEPKGSAAEPPRAAQKPAPPTAKETVPSAASIPNGSGAAQAAKGAAPANGTANPKDEKDADPVTAAKNHFGELLGALPDGPMHDLHGAFGEILGPNSATPRMQLLIYRYAIFLLEPPGEAPFSPPPF
jgi:hypothetical protein